jgi:hypothetical protein
VIKFGHDCSHTIRVLLSFLSRFPNRTGNSSVPGSSRKPSTLSWILTSKHRSCSGFTSGLIGWKSNEPTWVNSDYFDKKSAKMDFEGIQRMIADKLFNSFKQEVDDAITAQDGKLAHKELVQMFLKVFLEPIPKFAICYDDESFFNALSGLINSISLCQEEAEFFEFMLEFEPNFIAVCKSKFEELGVRKCQLGFNIERYLDHIEATGYEIVELNGDQLKEICQNNVDKLDMDMLRQA